ncbi:MAG: glycosyltransferase [Fimbriimonadaceae bacterium]|nr:glycosyltransferase [Fimbriimonadaceae bacterium]
MKPGIALAMIVRNDAARIERCLRSVKAVVEEMILVDTGSTDGTQDLARGLGARVVEKDWPDDFAEALNWAYDLVTHEWTLRLDSDEWLLPDSIPILRSLTARDDIFAATIIREDYVSDGRFTETQALRLWRTDPEMRMIGLVHEQFPNQVLDRVSRGRMLADSQIRLGHDGYTEEAMPAKHRRNLALVEKELSIRPGNIYYESERVRILYLLNDPRADAENNRLLEKLLEFRHLDQPPSAMVTGPLTLALDRLPESRLGDQLTTDILRLARGWCHRDPAVTYAAAKTFIRRKDLRSALDALLDLEHMSQTGDYQRSGFNHPSMLEEALWHNLALVAHQLGRKEVAARNYERLLRQNPNNAVARQNMALLLKG